MANNNLQKYFRMKPEVSQIFDDLEVYHQFCRDYGYVYDEKHLYNERSPYNEFFKMKKGREPWDQWRSPRRERNFNRPYNNGHHNNNYNRNDRG